MASLNKVMIIGNLGATPEMRYTANGNAVTTFNVAANETWNDQDGQRRDRTEWFSVVAWNKQAESCAKYLDKGSQVFVEGRLQTRSWETDGQKHWKTEVIAERVTFLTRTERSDDQPGDIDPDDLPFAFKEPSVPVVCEREYRDERWSI